MQRQPLLAELIARRELVLNFVVRNLKQRYKGSALGFLWSLLHPLFLVLVYLIFIRLMRFPTSMPHLLVGVMIWQFLSLCAGDAAGVVLGNASLVKKTWFPRVILPLSAVLGNLVHFVLSLLVLAVALPLLGVSPRGTWLHLPWLIALQFLFSLGVSLVLSALNVFFRDVEHLVPDRADVLVLRDSRHLFGRTRAEQPDLPALGGHRVLRQPDDRAADVVPPRFSRRPSPGCRALARSSRRVRGVFSWGRCSSTASNPASPMNCSRPLETGPICRTVNGGVA